MPRRAKTFRGVRQVGGGARIGEKAQRIWVCHACGHQHWNRPKSKCEGARCDNTTFASIASKSEAYRLAELRLLQRAGLISHLEMQPRFTLHTIGKGGLRVRLGEYIADFAYLRDGQRVVEDVKGRVMTDIAAWKIRHCEAEHGITVELYQRKP